MAEPAGNRRLRQPVSLLPDDRGQPDRVRRLRRRLPLRPQGRRRPTRTEPRRYRRLAAHFFITFPQLDDVRFSHRWAGAIDTNTRFCAHWGLARDGRVAYVNGFTGLGVGAARFAADVCLDLLGGAPTARPSWRWCARSRSRSRPSRSPASESRRRDGRWIGPTTPRVTATCCCARSMPSVSASTHRRIVDVTAAAPSDDGAGEPPASFDAGLVGPGYADCSLSSSDRRRRCAERVCARSCWQPR